MLRQSAYLKGMCYDIKTSLEAQLIKARRKGDAQAIKEIMEKLAPLTDLPIYHASGFQHPRLLIETGQSLPIVAHWGLIPHWVRDREQASKLWNSTLNARGESLHEKPSFRDSYRDKRCLIYVDGFYEHHHRNGKTFPYFIQAEDQRPISLGGLWSEWLDNTTGELIKTFTIVTTPANQLLGQIHNNPKMKGPRMPLVLDEEDAELWLFGNSMEAAPLIGPNKQLPLTAYTVARLRGNSYLGNVPEVAEKVVYPELEEV